MRSRQVVGRKIVRVFQERVYPPNHPNVTNVLGFELDNGDVLSFSVCEGEDDYYVEASVSRTSKSKGGSRGQ